MSFESIGRKLTDLPVARQLILHQYLTDALPILSHLFAYTKAIVGLTSYSVPFCNLFCILCWYCCIFFATFAISFVIWI